MFDVFKSTPRPAPKTVPLFVPEQHVPNEAEQYIAKQTEQKLKLLMSLRSAGIRDTGVLAAMERVPREHFVMQPFRDKAYDDTALPLLCGQTISQPSVVAKMTEALQLNDRMRVLEIGTGSGYQTAILAKVARMVYTIERQKQLYDEVVPRLESLRLRNVNTRCGDGYKGWSEAAPFDRILLTAAAPGIPKALIDQLSDDNGVMVMPYGDDASDQVLLRITKTPAGLQEEEVGAVRFVPMLPGVEE